jgi:hypothetical protein
MLQKYRSELFLGINPGTIFRLFHEFLKIVDEPEVYFRLSEV